MWLAELVMVVIPLILSTLSLGVAGLGNLAHVGRVGVRALLCFLGLTAASTALGLFLMNALGPGQRLDPAGKARLLETYRGQVEGAMGLSGGGFGIDLLVKIVPRNPVHAAANGDMLALRLPTSFCLRPDDCQVFRCVFKLVPPACRLA